MMSFILYGRHFPFVYILESKGIISIFCLIAVIYTGCSAYRDAPDYAVDDCHHERITGKVLKVWDKNTVLVELTDDGEQHSVGDKLLVNYEQMSVNDLYDEMEGLKNVDPDYQPVIGDYVYARVESVEKQKEYDYLTTKELTKYEEEYVED